MYGARAANGVILVTTRRGKPVSHSFLIPSIKGILNQR
ncbi:hypothetical protein KUH03_38710 [Sphingobacterium sp. E70]|nr:hypothetical protein [Sphingobacterium sp. E70]ULT29119.1 hypothetical protein KUH03_38710 [Sphingobacterium sp. E70]